MADRQLLSVAYRPFAAPEDFPRPYLVVHVTGPNGESGLIPGLIDSGADETSLPYEYAALMGYDESNLVEKEYGQVEGSFIGHKATISCFAVIPEIPDLTIELRPAFIEKADMVLWGRTDFMRHFDVTIQEAKQVFTLLTLDAPEDVTPSK